MNNKTTIAVLIIVALIGLGVFLIFSNGNGGQYRDNGQVSTTTDGVSGDGTSADGANGGTSDGTDQNNDNDPVVGYTTYTSSDLNFSILRPNAAQVSRETDNRVKFTFLGPENTANTEITDGLTLIIFKDPATSATTLRAYAEAKREETRQNEGENISALESRTVNGMPAYRYSFRNQLGSTTWEYVFLPKANQGYTATYTINDPNNRGYQSIVLSMLESLRFTQQ